MQKRNGDQAFGIPNDHFGNPKGVRRSRRAKRLTGRELSRIRTRLRDFESAGMAKDGDEARAARFSAALGRRSLTWLAREAGVAVSTCSGYARGKVPPGLAAVRIADALGVDLVWYLTGSARGRSDAAEATWFPRLTMEGAPAGVLPFAAEVAAEAGDGAFVLSVAGSAMAPTIPAGADALVAKGGDVVDGEVHVVRAAGRMLVRRLQVRADGRVVSVCDNPAFADEPIESVAGPDVVGRVVLVARRP